MTDFLKSEEKTQGFVYTDDQLMARLKFFIGICLSITLTGIVFVVLYSLIFVTQPLNAISPIDQKFFELIVPIATFLTGTVSGIMLAGTKKEDQDAFLAAQKQAQANYESAKAPVAPVTPPSVRPMVAPTPMTMPTAMPMNAPMSAPVTPTAVDPTINIKMSVPMPPQPVL
jgi:hypothetical protein